MRTLVIITAGHTDIQLAQRDVRAEFPKDNCAELHSQLESRSDWLIVDPPATKVSVHDLWETATLPVGTFNICTPKLDAIFAYDDIAGPETHVLILDTERSPDIDKGDPRMAGRILKRRVHERWRLPEANVVRQPYLSGASRLEDRNEPHDAIVRREVVDTIDCAVARAIESISPQRIVLAATGGLPAVRKLVAEVVRLHAGDTTLIPIDVADGRKAGPDGVADKAIPCAWIPEPAASYEARRHALHLIEGGNFIAAWGAVQHLHDGATERQWTRAVYWLQRFAASLLIPDECDIRLLKGHSMAARTALRVEMALRANDIPRAVQGTVAFFEAALWDHLYKYVEPVGQVDGRRTFKASTTPNPWLVRKSGNQKDRPFEPEGDLYHIFDDARCSKRLVTEYLPHLPALRALCNAVDKGVRYLRNEAAHSEPAPEIMQEARARLVRKALWSSHTAPRFLSQPLVHHTLTELGVSNAEGLYHDLITTVRARLLNSAKSSESRRS